MPQGLVLVGHDVFRILAGLVTGWVTHFYLLLELIEYRDLWLIGCNDSTKSVVQSTGDLPQHFPFPYKEMKPHKAS